MKSKAIMKHFGKKMTKPKAIILEVDGVLSDDGQRRHFIDRPFTDSLYGIIYLNEKPDYEAYHAACVDDPLNTWCLSMVVAAHVFSGYEILFVTQRVEKYRPVTNAWLLMNHPSLPLPPNKLFMRPDFISSWGPHTDRCEDLVQDNRPAHEVKREIYEREIRDKYDVLFVIERDEDCCNMYKELGLQILKVM